LKSNRYTALLEPAEEGGYVVKCVELPVATEGGGKEEAIRNIKEAIEGYLEVRAEVLGKSKAKKQLVEISVKQASSPFVA
jgi:predicted RNase H-like HicB family nuclease